jgi:hypothetical protein
VPYVDVQTIHNPATGAVAPAAWGDGVRDNQEFFIDPPTCSVYNSAAVSVANSSPTILNANSELFDNDALHSTVTNPSRVTAQTAGRYLLTSSAQFAANATGIRQIEFLLNGASILASVSRALPPGVGSDAFVKTFIAVVLAAGDYVEARVFQSSGGALNVTLVEFFAMFLTR